MPLIERARTITMAVPHAVACGQTAAHIWGLQITATPDHEWPVEVIAPPPTWRSPAA
ncbi:hypothetical protein [Nonomuraea salmonea]|uniref:hypothetical protein n=1 Tax=Nonomuraea salmonea TaxID=46181 RepID=UPI0031EFD5DA